MTQQRDLIAHQDTSLRIVVWPLAVKNFLPKAVPPARFHAGCRKIGHSRYNSVTSVMGHGHLSIRALRPSYAGCNGYGFPPTFLVYGSAHGVHTVEPDKNVELELTLSHARTA